MNSRQFRSSLVLAAVTLAVLALSLLLAFAAATLPRLVANGDVTNHATAQGGSGTHAPETTAQTPVAAPVARWPQLWPTGGADVGKTPQLRALLEPWAFVVDAIAAVGFAAVLIVRYNARRRRGART